MSEAEPQSIVDALRSDHRAITEQLDDPVALADSDEAHAVREQLVMALVRHFVAEEQYLYPTVRDRIEGGEELADAGIAADRECEKQLKQLEDHDLTPRRLTDTLAGVRRAFAEHVARQEAQLESVATACSARELAELGDGVIGAEQLAPTRPRHLAPTSGPANRVVSLVEGFIDQVRDHYSERGVDPDG